MNLISCANCGVVLDKNRLTFPDIYDDDGEIIRGTAEWDSYLERFVAITPCPVCKEPIPEED